VLEEVDDHNLLNEREQYWMDTLEAYNPKKGYNILRWADGKATMAKPRKEKPAPKRKEARTPFQVRVDPDLIERINAYAAHLGDANASQAIRRLIRLGLEVAERDTTPEAEAAR
jgi:hypothetical protein